VFLPPYSILKCRQVDPEFTKAKVDQILVEDWCTSTYTHHIGTILFLEDGSMVYGAGDGSHFQGIGKYLTCYTPRFQETP